MVFGNKLYFCLNKMKNRLSVAMPWLVVYVVLLLCSCGERKRLVPSEEDSTSMDLYVPADSVEDEVEQLVADTPMPKSAEGLFDDFFFNFASSSQLQRERIRFPLLVWRGEHADTIAKDKWEYERFFMRQGYYTLIFDDEEHADVVKDTSIDKAMVETIYFGTESVEQYAFDRKEGLWMLDNIRYIPIANSRNASFLKFYNQFATDSLFQIESLSEVVQISVPDPDDDFAYLDGVVTPETWPAFAPSVLPSGTIYNIAYGERTVDSNSRIFVVRGISNGMEMQLNFALKDNRWLLTKYKE